MDIQSSNSIGFAVAKMCEDDMIELATVAVRYGGFEEDGEIWDQEISV
jgi:hypothetical protein